MSLATSKRPIVTSQQSWKRSSAMNGCSSALSSIAASRTGPVHTLSSGRMSPLHEQRPHISVVEIRPVSLIVEDQAGAVASRAGSKSRMAMPLVLKRLQLSAAGTVAKVAAGSVAAAFQNMPCAPAPAPITVTKASTLNTRWPRNARRKAASGSRSA